jgi:hypothetical protein
MAGSQKRTFAFLKAAVDFNEALSDNDQLIAVGCKKTINISPGDMRSLWQK